jgi:hypothetical protein
MTLSQLVQYSFTDCQRLVCPSGIDRLAEYPEDVMRIFVTLIDDFPSKSPIMPGFSLPVSTMVPLINVHRHFRLFWSIYALESSVVRLGAISFSGTMPLSCRRETSKPHEGI